MTRVFFDFEFTALAYSAKPISIGCITDSGPQTFYAEFEGYTEGECSDFVIDHVLPKLRFRDAISGVQFGGIEGATNFKGGSFSIAQRLNWWLEDVWRRAGACAPVEMWGDVCAWDWMLFNQLYVGILPKFVYYIPFDIATVMKVKGVDPDTNRLDFVGTAQGTQHDALQDAATIALCYAKLMGE